MTAKQPNISNPEGSETPAPPVTPAESFHPDIEDIRHAIKQEILPEAVEDPDLLIQLLEMNCLLHERRISEILEILKDICPNKIQNGDQLEKWLLYTLMCMIDIGLHDEVFMISQEFVNLKPEHFGILIRLYCRYFFSEDQERAKRYYNLIIRIDPTKATRLEEYGIKSTIRQAPTRKPCSSWLHPLIFRGRFFAKRGDAERAARCFNFLDEKFPDHGFVKKDEYGYVVSRRKKRQLTPEQQKDMDQRETAYAAIKQNTPDCANAQAILTRILTVDRKNYFALMGLLCAALRDGDIDKQNKYRQKLVSYYPDDPEACLMAAKAEIASAKSHAHSGVQSRIKKCARAWTHLTHRMELMRAEDEQIHGKLDVETLALVNKMRGIGISPKELPLAPTAAALSITETGKTEIRQLRTKGDLTAAKKIMDDLLKLGLEDHTILMWRFEIALRENDSDIAHRLFEMFKWDISVRHARGCVERLNRLEEELQGGEPSYDYPSGHGGIWDTLGSRIPVDGLAADVTDFSAFIPR